MKSTRGLYSKLEIEMFEGVLAPINYSYLINILEPQDLYRVAVEKSFRYMLTGPYVEALRATFGAFCDCEPYRKTPEHDALIEAHLDK